MVGGGKAGLAAGYCRRRTGLDFVILDVQNETRRGLARLAEHHVGCHAGTLTADQYRAHRLDAGFIDVTVPSAKQHSVIIQAVTPT